MKKYFLLLSFAVGLVACNETQTPNEESQSIIGYDISEEGEQRELIAGPVATINVWEDYIEAHNKKDLEAIASLSAPENQTYIGTVTVSDVDSSSISFSVQGSNLAITPEGILSFVSPPDYEVKNAYSGTITATDGTHSANQEITVAVTDVDD